MNIQTTHSKACERTYESKLPYARKSQDPTAYDLRREDERRLRELFRNDLRTEYGLMNHPKEDLLFEIAWDHGHSAGYPEVARHYEDFARLLK